MLIDTNYNRRVLIVDDEVDLAECVADLIDFSGQSIVSFEYEYTIRHSGPDAIAEVKKQLEKGIRFSVIMLDIRMPGMNGVEACKKIREIDQHAEIIFMTGYTDLQPAEYGLIVGKDTSFLKKPFNSEVLKQNVFKCCHTYNQSRIQENINNYFSRVEQTSLLLEDIYKAIGEGFCQLAEFDLACITDKNLDLVWQDSESDIIAMIATMKNQKDNEVQKAHSYSVWTFGRIRFCKAEDFVVFFKTRSKANSDFDMYNILIYYVQGAERFYKRFIRKDELTRTKRLADLGIALAEVTHDLRTPITTLKSATYMIQKFPLDSVDSAELYDLVDSSFIAIEGYISDLLNYTKGESLNKTFFGLKNFLKELNRSITLTAAINKIKVSLPEVATETSVFGDRSKIQRAIFNIVNNSIDALITSKTSTPRIEVEIKENLPTTIVFKIKDNGPGIPEEVMPYIFEAFTTANKKTGTGLGCAIAKKFIGSHGGNISVKNLTSDNGTLSGACFEIEIPISRVEG